MHEAQVPVEGRGPETAARQPPTVLVLSSLFPSEKQPVAGIFIRERMVRVGAHVPLVFVSPQPWFPFQRLLRRWRPAFRPDSAREEQYAGFTIYRPRFLSFPGLFKWADGYLLAASTWWTVRAIARRHRVGLIDAHFAYPDGFGASLLATWLRLPLVLTLRGKEARQAESGLRKYVAAALVKAARVITVSEPLARLAVTLGADESRVTVIGNGVDSARYTPLPVGPARARFGLSPTARILISVGGLVERKGFHRVIACLPALLQKYPELVLLIAGGPGPEGSMESELRRQVAEFGLQDVVRFLGVLAPDELCVAYSAADVFVLATRYEGWANVFLEAMACGLPVVSTQVGGNAQVVSFDALGRLVPFDDREALTAALDAALGAPWDRTLIRRYAVENSWDKRVEQVLAVFERALAGDIAEPAPASLR